MKQISQLYVLLLTVLDDGEFMVVLNCQHGVGEALGPRRMIRSHVLLTMIVPQKCRRSRVAATPVPSSSTLSFHLPNRIGNQLVQYHSPRTCLLVPYSVSRQLCLLQVPECSTQPACLPRRCDPLASQTICNSLAPDETAYAIHN